MFGNVIEKESFDMLTGKEDLLQSLVEVYLMEKGTHDFYEMAVVKAENDEAKKAFRELSGWEQRHMEFIQYLYLSVQGDRDIEGFEAFKSRTASPFTESGMPVKDLETKLETHEFIDDLGAVDIALDIEGKAYNLYRRMSEKASDANAGVVFREMMGQEHKHVDFLKKMRTGLVKTA